MFCMHQECADSVSYVTIIEGSGNCGEDNIVTTTPVAREQLAQLLVPGETVEATSVQLRLFALTHRRTIIAATSNRFIGITRGLLGDYEPIDIRWQDLNEARLKVGVFGAELTVRASDATDLAGAGTASELYSFGGLEKSSAQAVYRICQAKEQAWREKRRIRELEELRARSGGIQFGGAPGAAGASDKGAIDPVERLAQAREMLDKGLITDAEYEGMKAKVISEM